MNVRHEVPQAQQPILLSVSVRFMDRTWNYQLKVMCLHLVGLERGNGGL
jgi:hypothetical protein